MAGQRARPVGRLTAEQRRAQLLQVAAGLFSAQGFHASSMEQLAEAAGVSKPVLYQHFASKRELYVALLHDVADELERRVREALEGTRDNRARVDGAIGAFFDCVADPQYRLLFAADVVDDEVRDLIDAVHDRISVRIGALIAEDAGLPESSASFLAAAVRGLAVAGAQWWLQHEEVPGKPEAVRLLARLAWRGLGSFGAEQEDAGAVPKPPS